MSSPAEPFADNWAYLKAELTLLERTLMIAVARQRREVREVDLMAQSKADRVSSHWWKGLILPEGEAFYDDRKPPAQDNQNKGSLPQHLEARIRASHDQGIILGLPTLRDRLCLTPFEKNLVLMSLAPEINRRYARIYQYLQESNGPPERRPQTVNKTLQLPLICAKDPPRPAADLPIVDLALRILCRNDSEWRDARSRLMGESPLMQLELLQLLGHEEDTLLTCRIKSTQPLVTYLLSNQPNQDALDALVETVPTPQGHLPPHPSQGLQEQTTLADWADLVLPPPIVLRLQALANPWPSPTTLAPTTLDRSPPDVASSIGTIALFTGASGTGKRLAAQVIAQARQTPLTWIDLAVVPTSRYSAILQTILRQHPQVLLIRNAHCWLKRSTPIPTAALHHFFEQRRSQSSLTVLTTSLLPAIHLPWQHQMDEIIALPMPDRQARQQLWQQALSPLMPLDADLDWPTLAQRSRLTGGAIQQIAHRAARYAQATPGPLTMAHIRQAIRDHTL